MGTIVAIDRQTIDSWDGYKITTTEQEICLFLSNEQLCCEDFGVSMSLPAGVRQNGIGSRVQSVRWGKDFQDSRPESNGATLEIATSQGLIIISAWNNHNGFYAHELRASWKGYEDEQQL